MSNLSWTIGDATITRVVELDANMPMRSFLPAATDEKLEPHKTWLRPHFLDDDNNISLSIHALLIESCGKRIIVDTCVGEMGIAGFDALTPEKFDFPDKLAAAGFPRESIDYVLCTHLHFDHVGWNTMRQDNQWVATFSNAKYLFSKEEWAFWEHEEDPFEKETKADSIIPVIESGQVEWVDMDHQVTDSVRLIPTPGHTPGHVSVLIESQGATAVITGDLFHHPLQFARPHWKDIADVDGPLAEKSRIEFMQQFQTPTLVLGTHFAHPTAGTIVKDGDSFRFDVE